MKDIIIPFTSYKDSSPFISQIDYFSYTFEKHAPMWTLGVGGSPLDTGLGCVDDDGGGVGDDDGRLPERSRLRRGGALGEPQSLLDPGKKEVNVL